MKYRSVFLCVLSRRSLYLQIFVTLCHTGAAYKMEDCTTWAWCSIGFFLLPGQPMYTFILRQWCLEISTND
ncbi:hypothetical protein NQ317_004690 [Molorchus minor]|uniref:Secreted protein n=1 Tax=Molorchus minor TaxID=1323400 RepID=A0ABQ9JFW9_9CUCU|nr:hypothetical protein NQ317_004690 [Molorchus minor]